MNRLLIPSFHLILLSKILNLKLKTTFQNFISTGNHRLKKSHRLMNFQQIKLQKHKFTFHQKRIMKFLKRVNLLVILKWIVKTVIMKSYKKFRNLKWCKQNIRIKQQKRNKIWSICYSIKFQLKVRELRRKSQRLSTKKESWTQEKLIWTSNSKNSGILNVLATINRFKNSKQKIVKTN